MLGDANACRCSGEQFKPSSRVVKLLELYVIKRLKARDGASRGAIQSRAVGS